MNSNLEKLYGDWGLGIGDKEEIKEIKEEPTNIESKPVIKIETGNGIVLTREVKEVEKTEKNEPQVIINGVNILPEKKKEEEKSKSQSGIIFKKLIKTEDNNQYEDIKIKPRKLKTKILFNRSKIDITNENPNIESKVNNKQTEKKENSEVKQNEIVKNEDVIMEKPQEEGNAEKGENKEEKGGNLQENNNEEIKK